MGAPAWHGENELITEVDPDFGEVMLLNGTRSLESITRFSNELARSSVVALDAALRDKMVLDVAAKIDQAFFTGAGTGTDAAGEPLGLLNYTGVQSVAAVGTLDLDELLDAVALMYTANVDTSWLRWVMPSRTVISIRKLKGTSGKYLVEPDATQNATFRLFGIPVLVTNRIPTNGGAGTNEGSVVLADFSPIAVARDLAPSVKLLEQTYADLDQQAIRVAARDDAAPPTGRPSTTRAASSARASCSTSRTASRRSGSNGRSSCPRDRPRRRARRTRKAQRPAPAVEPPGRGAVEGSSGSSQPVCRRDEGVPRSPLVARVPCLVTSGLRQVEQVVDLLAQAA